MVKSHARMHTISGQIISITAALFSSLFSTCLFAANYSSKPKEHWYQDVWCKGKGGQIEFKLNDGRRVDCLTAEHAIEVEFARKWPEAIGQSLDYSMLTGRKAGIVLILQRDSDHTYWESHTKTEESLPVTYYPMEAWALNNISSPAGERVSQNSVQREKPGVASLSFHHRGTEDTEFSYS